MQLATPLNAVKSVSIQRLQRKFSENQSLQALESLVLRFQPLAVTPKVDRPLSASLEDFISLRRENMKKLSFPAHSPCMHIPDDKRKSWNFLHFINVNDACKCCKVATKSVLLIGLICDKRLQWKIKAMFCLEIQLMILVSFRWYQLVISKLWHVLLSRNQNSLLNFVYKREPITCALSKNTRKSAADLAR